MLLIVEDWPKDEMCCLFGGLTACWDQRSGRTFAACCSGKGGHGCLSWNDEDRCWNLQKEPQYLQDVVEIAYIMEPAAEYSHARLLARLLLAVAMGNGAIHGRPDHGKGGFFPGLDVVEVGVQEGFFADTFLEAATEVLQLPIRRYSLVDRWAAPPRDIVGGSLHDESDKDTCASSRDHAVNFAATVGRLAPRWPDVVRFLQAESATVADWMRRDGEQADFIFLDARHDYDSVWEDLVRWWPVLKVGGVFAGHDYENERSDDVGVKRAVDEFAWALGLQVVGPFRQCWMMAKATDVKPPVRPDWLQLH